MKPAATFPSKASSSRGGNVDSSGHQYSDPVIFYGVFGLLLFGPLVFGAVEPWSIFVLEAGSTVLFTIWIWQQFSSSSLTIHSNPLFLPMSVFGTLVLMQIVSGKSAYRYATLSSTLLYVAYGLLCFLLVQCLTNRRQIKIFVTYFSGYGFAVATFALLQGLAPNGKLYWLRTPRGGGWIYGPYVNHNHYAGLMEMLFPIPLVFSLTNYARGGLRTLAILASALMATTIFLSGSRGGMVSFCCQIIFLFAVLLRHQGHVFRKGKVAFAFFAIALLFFLVWIGGHELTSRIVETSSSRYELSTDLRVQIDKDMVKMFPHRPILGWGLGTFGEVYPQYRSSYSVFHLDEAHNDYLQLLIETGAVGFMIMIWFLCLVFYASLKKLRNWPTDIDGAVSLAAVLGVVGILVHSLVDFNLQVPANAALFYVFCTIAAMEPHFDPAVNVLNNNCHSAQ